MNLFLMKGMRPIVAAWRKIAQKPSQILGPMQGIEKKEI